MGNKIFVNTSSNGETTISETYNKKESDKFTKITKNELNEIYNDNKNMVVDFFDKDIIISKIKQSENSEFSNNINYFQNMLNFYDNNNDKKIYKKTDCLCSKELNLCIINKNAQKLRQIHDNNNYDEQDYYKSTYSSK